MQIQVRSLHFRPSPIIEGSHASKLIRGVGYRTSVYSSLIEFNGDAAKKSEAEPSENRSFLAEPPLHICALGFERGKWVTTYVWNGSRELFLYCRIDSGAALVALFSHLERKVLLFIVGDAPQVALTKWER